MRLEHMRGAFLSLVLTLLSESGDMYVYIYIYTHTYMYTHIETSCEISFAEPLLVSPVVLSSKGEQN